MESIKHCFAGGNTSIGFYSLFNEMALNLERLYILVGGSTSLKSSMMKRFGSLVEQEGYAIEYLHSLIEYQELEGVIIPELKVGLIDGNSAHSIKPQYPGIRDIVINLGEYWDQEIISTQKDIMIQLTDEIQKKLTLVHQQFALAKKAHEQKENIYISAMDFTKANQVTDQLIATIFAGPITKNEFNQERHFFLGASTPEGPINYIDNITQNIAKRYILKGRSGSGKSTVMRKVAKKAHELGLEVEYYHCSFDPISLDMIIIPTLSVAILDGTSPHVIEPSRVQDEVIDMFLLSINPQVEIDHADQLSYLNSTYRKHIHAGINFLKEARDASVQLDELYLEAIDLDGIKQLEQQWIQEILQNVGMH